MENTGMKEQIIALISKIGTQVGWTENGWEKVYTKEDCADEIDKLIQDDIDLAYCAGVFNTGGIDVLGKELERLKHIGRKPHQIFQRYKQATNIIEKVKETNTPDKRSFEEAEATKRIMKGCLSCKYDKEHIDPCCECWDYDKWEPIKTE